MGVGEGGDGQWVMVNGQWGEDQGGAAGRQASAEK